LLPRSTTLLALVAPLALASACGGSAGTSRQTNEPPSPGSPAAETPIVPEQPAPEEPGVPSVPHEPVPGIPTDPQKPAPEEPTDPDPEAPAPEEPTDPEEPGPPAATVPAELLDLTSWKLTLPVETSHAGNPDEIRQPELAGFALAPFFHLTPEADGVVFRAPVDGATTSGSGYPRSELREMIADGSDEAGWSTTSGTHTLEIRQAITHLPEVKAHVVAGQIHDAEDDVIMIRLEGEHLFVEGGGDELATLDDAYELGTVFTVRIEAGEGRIRVYLDDVLKLDLAHEADGCYFKAGAYTQSNLEKGDKPGAYGEVVIYDLALSHRD